MMFGQKYRNGKQNTGRSPIAEEKVPEKLTIEWLRGWASLSSDLTIQEMDREMTNSNERIVIVYFISMTNKERLNEFLRHSVNEWMVRSSAERTSAEEWFSRSSSWKKARTGQDAAEAILEGMAMLFLPECGLMLLADISDIPQRAPEEANAEVSIKGPRDGFVECLATNIALVRKRLATPLLCAEGFTIGSLSRTKVSIMYLNHIANPRMVEQTRARLREINVDTMIGSGRLEEFLASKSIAMFPLVDSTGRPDFVTESLSRGRIAILVDGSPTVLIAPVSLFMLMKSPEDSHSFFFFVFFERFIRLLGLFLSLFLPGFWVALAAYEIDQLPMPLLAMVTNSRFGIPFSVPVEALLMLVMFELFREAGAKLPKPVGQIVAVVGGLVVGDSAIRAGLTSPSLLVVSAVCAVATFTLINQSLSGTVSLIRLCVLLLASFFGMFGFFIGMLATLAYLSTLESLGVPYLSPIAPLRLGEVAKALFTLPWRYYRDRPKELHTLNPDRKDGTSP
ncbi:spore germination protein [Paenibacillus sp. HB172176]|uniref:spore germination protein n=1 Tax=Paenibacillus sp. HB172176 TaxID=2493690 RepID=UPI00143A95D4|nr:spore germination protein [Paenibacillus sp. HB172176]